MSNERLPQGVEAFRYRQRGRWLKSLDAYIEQNRPIPERERRLRDNQLTAVEALREKLDSGKVKDRGYFQIPSGVENRLFAEVTHALQEKTIIVAENLFNLMRMEDELSQLDGDVDIGRVFGGRKEYGRNCTLITYNTLLHDPNINSSDVGLVLFLQAHLAMTEKREAIIRRFGGALKIAATVAPKYSEEKQLSEILPPLIHKESTKDASKDGHLSPFSTFTNDTDVDVSEIQVTADGDFDEHQLAQALNKKSLNQSAVAVYKRKRFVGKPALAYCVDIAHAKSLAAEFKEAGVSADVLSGELSANGQRKLRKKFRENETQVLCTTNIVVEEPHAVVCLNLRPTLSQVFAELRGGGVLPLDYTNPDKHAYIIDFVPVDRKSNKKPITYAEIVEETAHGLVHPKKDDSLSPARTNIEVQGIKVETHLHEVLSVFDDISRENLAGLQTDISINALCMLLEKDATTIANRLPFYFRGNMKQVNQSVREPLEKFSIIDQNPNQDIRLPTEVLQNMILDAIYQKLYGKEIMQSIPEQVASLVKKSKASIELFPTLQERLPIIQEISKQVKEKLKSQTEDDPQLIEAFEREMDAFAATFRVSELPTDAYRSRRARTSFLQTKDHIDYHRREEVRDIRRKRMLAFLKRSPGVMISMLQSGDMLAGQSIVARTADLADAAEVKQKITTTVERVSVKGDGGNMIDFVKKTGNSSNTFSRIESVNNQLERFQQLDRVISYIKNHTNEFDDQSSAIFTKGVEIMEQLFEMVTRQLDSNQMNHSLRPDEVSNLIALRTSLSTQQTKLRIIRTEVRNAIATNPGIVDTYLSLGSDSTLLNASPLMGKIRKNPQYSVQ